MNLMKISTKPDFFFSLRREVSNTVDDSCFKIESETPDKGKFLNKTFSSIRDFGFSDEKK